MTRRTDPIFEVFDANDAFRSTPSEEEMQQVWDLIGPLMERYLRLRPIWQVAAGAFIEGFETGALKRLMWYGEGPFPKDSIADQQDPPPSKRPMIIGTTPIHDYPRLPKELLTEEEAADYLQIRVQTLSQWRSGYRKKEKRNWLTKRVIPAVTRMSRPVFQYSRGYSTRCGGSRRTSAIAA